MLVLLLKEVPLSVNNYDFKKCYFIYQCVAYSVQADISQIPYIGGVKTTHNRGILGTREIPETWQKPEKVSDHPYQSIIPVHHTSPSYQSYRIPYQSIIPVLQNTIPFHHDSLTEFHTSPSYQSYRIPYQSIIQYTATPLKSVC